LSVEAPKVVAKAPVAKETENTNTPEIASEEVKPAEPPALTVAVPKIVEEPQAPNEPTQVAEKPKTTKPKRTRRTKKLSTNKKEKIEKVDAQKEQTSA
jgi:hypothetical protein